MPDRLVVDASVALAIILEEPDAPQAMRALGGVAAGGRVIVPDHFWLEVGNVLVRRYRWDADSVVAAFRDLDALGIETTSIAGPTMLLALDLSIRHGLTAYDAAYLALAHVADASLLTLDTRLASAAGDRSALPARPRAHEELEPYGKPASPPDWSLHGRYLAELRYAARNS